MNIFSYQVTNTVSQTDCPLWWVLIVKLCPDSPFRKRRLSPMPFPLLGALLVETLSSHHSLENASVKYMDSIMSLSKSGLHPVITQCWQLKAETFILTQDTSKRPSQS